MIFKNKNIGDWMKNATDIDNVAYDCYCEDRKNAYPRNITSQYIIMRFPNIYYKFYEIAKVKIRKYKLEKINEKW